MTTMPLSPSHVQTDTNTMQSEAWRYTGPFTRYQRFRGLFPGFGIGLAAFAGYMVYEQVFMSSGHAHAEVGHEEGHH